MEQGRVAREPVVLTHKNEKWPTRRTAETQISEETPPTVPGEVKQTSQKGPWGRHWVSIPLLRAPTPLHLYSLSFTVLLLPAVASSSSGLPSSPPSFVPSSFRTTSSLKAPNQNLPGPAPT